MSLVQYKLAVLAVYGGAALHEDIIFQLSGFFAGREGMMFLMKEDVRTHICAVVVCGRTVSKTRTCVVGSDSHFLNLGRALLVSSMIGCNSREVVSEED